MCLGYSYNYELLLFGKSGQWGTKWTVLWLTENKWQSQYMTLASAALPPALNYYALMNLRTRNTCVCMGLCLTWTLLPAKWAPDCTLGELAWNVSSALCSWDSSESHIFWNLIFQLKKKKRVRRWFYLTMITSQDHFKEQSNCICICIYEM